MAASVGVSAAQQENANPWLKTPASVAWLVELETLKLEPRAQEVAATLSAPAVTLSIWASVSATELEILSATGSASATEVIAHQVKQENSTVFMDLYLQTDLCSLTTASAPNARAEITRCFAGVLSSLFSRARCFSATKKITLIIRN